MDEILKKAQELKEELYQKEEFKEYFRLKKLYAESDEIKSILIQLKECKVNSEEYNALLEQHNSYPLVVNLKKAEEEVEEILLTVTSILKL